MLRGIYFALALMFAALGVVSGFIGFGIIGYQISINGLPLDVAIQQGSVIGFAISAISIIGWIVFSCLFVIQDDKEEHINDIEP